MLRMLLRTSQIPHGTKRQSLTLRQLCDIYAVVTTAAIAANLHP